MSGVKCRVLGLGTSILGIGPGYVRWSSRTSRSIVNDEINEEQLIAAFCHVSERTFDTGHLKKLTPETRHLRPDT